MKIMNWYKKSSKKSIKEAEIWINNYAQTHGGQECLIYGQCAEFAEDLTAFLNDLSAEEWGLWTIWDEWHNKLPYINPDSKQTEKIIGKNKNLTYIGSEDHIVVRWNGFWWDGYGKQSLDQIMKNFANVRNPHWFKY